MAHGSGSEAAAVVVAELAAVVAAEVAAAEVAVVVAAEVVAAEVAAEAEAARRCGCT